MLLKDETDDTQDDPHPDRCRCRGCRYLAFEEGVAACETCDAPATVDRTLAGGLGAVYLCAACDRRRRGDAMSHCHTWAVLAQRAGEYCGGCDFGENAYEGCGCGALRCRACGVWEICERQAAELRQADGRLFVAEKRVAEVEAQRDEYKRLLRTAMDGWREARVLADAPPIPKGGTWTKCSGCGHDVPPKAARCEHCGKDLAKP